MVMLIQRNLDSRPDSVAGTWFPGTRDRDQGPGPGPGTRTRDQDQGPGDRDQGTKDQGPGAKDRGPGTKDQVLGQGPRTRERMKFSSNEVCHDEMGHIISFC